VIDVALGNSQTTFSHLRLRPRDQIKQFIEPIGEIVTRFYIRVMARDEPGVVARYGKILADHQISISGALQHEGTGPGDTVPVVITTHRTQERNMAAALAELRKMDIISGKPVCVRIVDIPQDKDA